MELQQSPGFVIWLTGMKKAGKTTLATQLAQRLALVGRLAGHAKPRGRTRLPSGR